MKIRLPHAPYIANKIAIDLLNSHFITFTKGLEPVKECAQEIIEEDIKKEIVLEERVEEILEDNEDEMEFMRVDRKNMFWLIKKKLADEYSFTLSYEDRFSNVAHKILEILWEKDLINYTVSENMAKNVIYGAIENYIDSYEDIQDLVLERIGHYKRKLIPGTQEYDLVFEKLYQEELKRKGML